MKNHWRLENKKRKKKKERKRQMNQNHNLCILAPQGGLRSSFLYLKYSEQLPRFDKENHSQVQVNSVSILVTGDLLYNIMVSLGLLWWPRWQRICLQYRRPGWGRSPGEVIGNPLQYSCLENSKDRRASWATVHGVSKNQTQPSD